MRVQGGGREQEGTQPRSTCGKWKKREHLSPGNSCQSKCAARVQFKTQTSIKIHAKEQGLLGGLGLRFGMCRIARKNVWWSHRTFESEMPGGGRRIFRVSVFPEWRFVVHPVMKMNCYVGQKVSQIQSCWIKDYALPLTKMRLWSLV